MLNKLLIIGSPPPLAGLSMMEIVSREIKIELVINNNKPILNNNTLNSFVLKKEPHIPSCFVSRDNHYRKPRKAKW
jgi:hypothetical protein